jgi:YggT family protein
MLLGIVSLLLLALRVVEIAVIGYVLAGWLGLGDDNPLMRALRLVAEPPLRLVRPLARRLPGPLDWSPMIVLVGLWFARRLIAGL